MVDVCEMILIFRSAIPRPLTLSWLFVSKHYIQQRINADQSMGKRSILVKSTHQTQKSTIWFQTRTKNQNRHGKINFLLGPVQSSNKKSTLALQTNLHSYNSFQHKKKKKKKMIWVGVVDPALHRGNISLYYACLHCPLGSGGRASCKRHWTHVAGPYHSIHRSFAHAAKFNLHSKKKERKEKK